MSGFVCPRCYLEFRPQAFFFSGGESWWSAAPADLPLYHHFCPDRHEWPNGRVLGCASMRAAIDPWLRSERREAPVFGAGELSIVDVAEAGFPVEARGDVAVSVPPVIGGSFAPDQGAEFTRNPGAVEVSCYALRDVVLVASRSLLFHHGERIAETRYMVGDDDYWRDPPAPREVHRLDAGTTAVLGINRASSNYYHWLMQTLPAIDAAVGLLGARALALALPKLAAWQEETLAMLGYGDLPRLRIDLDCHYHFASAYYCTYLNGSAAFAVSPRCLEVLERLASGVEPSETAPQRIYVARLDTGNRRIRNEAAVMRLLESHGFVTLVPGQFSPREQISRFRAARVIVGAHGAGLTNIAFCETGTTLLELTQSNYQNTCINRIAQGKGLRYFGECFAVAEDPAIHGQDWDIDLPRLERALAAII